MKKIIFLVLCFQFFPSYALNLTFQNAKNNIDKIEYPWDISLTKPLDWYIDFWNNISVKKNYQTTILIWEWSEDLPYYKKSPIPQLGDDFIYIKKILWDTKFNTLLSNYKLSIYWEQNKCDDGMLIHPSLKQEKISCLYENDKNLSTNTKNIVSYALKSSKKQTIKVKIFPVTDKEYLFYTYDDAEKGTFPIFTFLDTSLEYYDISYQYSNNKTINWFSAGSHNFEKKYILTQFDKNTYKLPNNVWIVKEMLNTTYTFIPYYESEINLEEWTNTLVFTYNSYTSHKEELKNNIIIQQ